MNKQKILKAPFRYEPDELDPDGLFTVRDGQDRFVCHALSEDIAQIIVIALSGTDDDYFVSENIT